MKETKNWLLNICHCMWFDLDQGGRVVQKMFGVFFQIKAYSLVNNIKKWNLIKLFSETM